MVSSTSEPGPQKGLETVDTAKSSVWREQGNPHPHACYDGWIYLAYTAYDESVGDEGERIEVIPCRRCAEAWGRAS